MKKANTDVRSFLDRKRDFAKIPGKEGLCGNLIYLTQKKMLFGFNIQHNSMCGIE